MRPPAVCVDPGEDIRYLKVRYRSVICQALPTIMREGLIGLRHAEDVVLALVRAALLGLGIEQLVREALRHRLLAALTRELDQPAHRQRAGTARRDLDGHLVGGATDAA